MDSEQAQKINGSKQKRAKFVAPGTLAKNRANGQKTWKSNGVSSGIVEVSKSTIGTKRLQLEGHEAHNNSKIKMIDGMPAHTIRLHYGDDIYEDKDFTEESSFLDILKLCSRLIDIYSVGFKITYGGGKTIRNDRELLAMLKEYEHVDCINIYLHKDADASPVLFKLPQDNPASSIPTIPKAENVRIFGDYKTNGKVIVRGDVVDGYEDESMVQFFISAAKNFQISDLKAITGGLITKELQVPIEAVGHYIVAKFTPMSEIDTGEATYVVSEERVNDAEVPHCVRKTRGKNKNKKIAGLKSGEKLEIQFFNNRAVGDNHAAWSRHLGKVVRDNNICPVRVKTWKDIANKDHMWAAVKKKRTEASSEEWKLLKVD